MLIVQIWIVRGIIVASLLNPRLLSGARADHVGFAAEVERKKDLYKI